MTEYFVFAVLVACAFTFLFIYTKPFEDCDDDEYMFLACMLSLIWPISIPLAVTYVIAKTLRRRK